MCVWWRVLRWTHNISVISLLKLDSFGLCSSPSALPTKTISVLSLSSRNQNSFKWNKFRLSLPIMNSTLSHFTHFRATCNFNTDELIKTYYLRGKTTEFNILLPNGGPCVTSEYIYGCIKTRSHWGGFECPFNGAKERLHCGIGRG